MFNQFSCVRIKVISLNDLMMAVKGNAPSTFSDLRQRSPYCVLGVKISCF
jgi:hypothetical protein